LILKFKFVIFLAELARCSLFFIKVIRGVCSGRDARNKDVRVLFFIKVIRGVCSGRDARNKDVRVTLSYGKHVVTSQSSTIHFKKRHSTHKRSIHGGVPRTGDYWNDLWCLSFDTNKWKLLSFKGITPWSAHKMWAAHNKLYF
jgi:hypothetical protein